MRKTEILKKLLLTLNAMEDRLQSIEKIEKILHEKELKEYQTKCNKNLIKS